MTITDFCEELHNWFDVDRIFGTFTISNGEITVTDGYLQNNQYFRIVGSVFNDGVYKYPASDLIDETFQGAIWAMAVPPAAIALFEKAQEWDLKYANDPVANSPYQSESFGGYSYSKGYNSSANGSDTTVSWQKQFKSRLNKWRKLR